MPYYHHPPQKTEIDDGTKREPLALFLGFSLPLVHPKPKSISQLNSLPISQMGSFSNSNIPSVLVPKCLSTSHPWRQAGKSFLQHQIHMTLPSDWVSPTFAIPSISSIPGVSGLEMTHSISPSLSCCSSFLSCSSSLTFSTFSSSPWVSPPLFLRFL